MTTVKLTAPAGTTLFTTQSGVQLYPDANGVFTIDPTVVDVNDLLAAGFQTFVDTAAASASRPTTGLYSGLMFFDTTLNKPVWRNATNSGWVDATGTAA